MNNINTKTLVLGALEAGPATIREIVLKTELPLTVVASCLTSLRRDTDQVHAPHKRVCKVTGYWRTLYALRNPPLRVPEEPAGGTLESVIKERDMLREALQELLALKQFASEHTVRYTPKQFDTAAAAAEYESRKPKAWAAARAAITPMEPIK